MENWFNAWEPGGYIDIERVDPAADGGMLIGSLVLAAFVVAGVVVSHRTRVVRRSFSCVTAGRDVEVRFRRSHVLSCSAFEEPAAIACARRCTDRAFRAQWSPALPVFARSSNGRRAS